jgi:hypothetical protein
MNLAEYYGVERLIEREARALAQWCSEHGRFGMAKETSISQPMRKDEAVLT